MEKIVEIFINLKRFDVPRELGGICPKENPSEWIEWVIDESVRIGLGALQGFNITYLLPEGLIISAIESLRGYPDSKNIHIGSQGVFRENIQRGGNFGALTTNLPAAAARNLGCTWSIIGHSEERKDKLGVIAAYDPSFSNEQKSRIRAARVVNDLINREVLCALDSGLNVLLCVGETAEERGSGTIEEQKPRIEVVLRDQLEECLKGVRRKWEGRKIIIGYEPIWAIGPGKNPPGAEYISFVSSFIKKTTQGLFGFDPVVVYGGGLKEENAATIAGIDSIGGGLVALTKFTGEIAFQPEGLKRIIDKYL